MVGVVEQPAFPMALAIVVRWLMVEQDVAVEELVVVVDTMEEEAPAVVVEVADQAFLLWVPQPTTMV